MVGFADRLILSRDAVRSFAKRTMLLRHVNPLPRPAKRVPPCRRRGSYCAADNRGLREASPEARHRSPTAKCCRCFAADQRAAYPPCDWFDGTKTGQKPPADFRGPSRGLRITHAPRKSTGASGSARGRGGVTKPRPRDQDDLSGGRCIRAGCNLGYRVRTTGDAAAVRGFASVVPAAELSPGKAEGSASPMLRGRCYFPSRQFSMPSADWRRISARPSSSTSARAGSERSAGPDQVQSCWP